MSKSKTIRPVDVILIWDDAAQMILHYVFRDGWAWNDFHQAMKQASSLTQQAQGRTLHSVLDFTAAPSIRAGAFYHFSQAANQLTDTYARGQIIVVSASPILWAIIRVTAILLPQFAKNLSHVPTLDAAYAALRPSINSELETQF